MVGRTISHYRILEKIGEGGMGVVYKARDTHLDRFVAIKLLQPQVVDDAERRRRFVQEAKAASALNHPNIVTVHDIDTAEGVTFIAMEYVAGKTLDEVLRSKGMRVSEALNYAIQVADALAAAHAAGIVHRDLKPSNIVAGDDGRVRILDFGLAKLTPAGGAAGVTATMTAAPISDAGTVLGTFAYMSPEQAQGASVDSRSDVFSFGVVLYEMLAGRHPFRRESRISTLAAIVGEDPKPLSDDRASLPPEVERTVLRCLRKEPQRRWQNMSDLKSVLEDLKDESDSGTLRQAGGETVFRPPRRARLAVAIFVAAAVVVGAGAFVWFRTWRPAPGDLDLELSPLTLDAGFSGGASISRDGKIVVYASDRSGEGLTDVWVRHVDRPRPVRRTRDAGGVQYPSISPDGSRIVYRSQRDGGGVYIIDTLGEPEAGEERKLASGGLWPRFSPDGNSIAFAEEMAGDPVGNKMFLVSPDGGEPRPFQPGFSATPAPNGTGPVWSPDSRSLIFNGVRRADGLNGWWIASVDGGAPVLVDTGVYQKSIVWFPTAWPRDDMLITAEGVTIEGINLYRAGISPSPWRLTGTRARLTSGPGLRYDAAVASDGRLVFSIMTWMSNVWAIARDQASGKAVGDPQMVSQDSQTKNGAAVSTDGARVAYCGLTQFAHATQVPRIELRLRDVGTGRERVVETGPTIDMRPRLNGDASLIAYQRTTPEGPAAFVSTVSGDSRRVCTRCRILGFFPEANDVLVLYPPGRMVRQPLSGQKQDVVLALPAGVIADGRLSADGRWVAYVLYSPAGRAGLYVAPLGATAGTGAAPILVEESDTARVLEPCWSPDGNFVYYLSLRDGGTCIWARRFDSRSGRLVGDSFAAFHAHGLRPGFFGGGRWNWGLNATRDRFYAIMSETKSNVWTARLPQ